MVSLNLGYTSGVCQTISAPLPRTFYHQMAEKSESWDKSKQEFASNLRIVNKV